MKLITRCFANSARQAQNRQLCNILSERSKHVYASGPIEPPGQQGSENEEPPGAFATVSMMGLGAVGAIGVAGLGVVAVFQIANFVASGTGRSMVASPQAVQRSDNDVDVEKKKLLEDSQR